MSAVLITVVRPFVYTHPDGREERFNPGQFVISGSMLDDPWLAVDFADGRISHINGVPCHQYVGDKPVTDHRIAARKARDQLITPGRNPTVRLEIHDTRPAMVEGDSLNLAGKVNIIQ